MDLHFAESTNRAKLTKPQTATIRATTSATTHREIEKAQWRMRQFVQHDRQDRFQITLYFYVHNVPANIIEKRFEQRYFWPSACLTHFVTWHELNSPATWVFASVRGVWYRIEHLSYGSLNIRG